MTTTIYHTGSPASSRTHWETRKVKEGDIQLTPHGEYYMATREGWFMLTTEEFDELMEIRKDAKWANPATKWAMEKEGLFLVEIWREAADRKA